MGQDRLQLTLGNLPCCLRRLGSQSIAKSTAGDGNPMYQMMDGYPGWGMGVTGILFLILVLLAIAALLKYLFRG